MANRTRPNQILLLIGALSFFPALALGPLAEFFGSIA